MQNFALNLTLAAFNSPYQTHESKVGFVLVINIVSPVRNENKLHNRLNVTNIRLYKYLIYRKKCYPKTIQQL